MSHGRQIMADINLIRAAITEQGDRLQKLPRQAVWVIHRPNGKSYRLTYQPAPLSGGAIHPPDSEASYLLGVIDRALHPPTVNDHEETSTVYQQQLYPWCIIQLLPEMQRRVVARFRRRNDADAHLRVLRQQAQLRYTIVFDPSPAQTCVAVGEHSHMSN